MGSRRKQLTRNILEKMDSKTRTILWVYIAVVAVTISYFIYPVFASPLSGEKADCLDDWHDCYDDENCCDSPCYNFICRPDKSKKEDDCFPDYAGPCFDNADCCDQKCSNFICRPAKNNKDCLPDYIGP